MRQAIQADVDLLLFSNNNARVPWCAADGEVRRLSAADVTRAVLAESSALSVSSTQYFVAALRSFLRFYLIEDLVDVDLSPRRWP